MSIACIEDFRRLARKRLPKAVFEFVDGGATDEVTLRANRADFDRLTFMPRVLTDVSKRDLSTTVLGTAAAMPLIVAPTGLAGMLARNGELAKARASDAAGIPYCLSQMASSSIEDVKAARRAPFWFQSYFVKDRAINGALIDRAESAGCDVLVITVDTKAQGQRERDIRNGFTVPPKVTLGNLFDMVKRLHWIRDVALGPRVTFANLAGSLVDSKDVFSIARFAAEQYDVTVDWSQIDWARARWKGKLALKGVLTASDTRIAIDHGVDGIIVSNHGGRQLDGVSSPIAALPEIVEAADGRAEVILDGGVRRGSDIAKALALGARACMAGRAFLWGLAADGERGVARVMQMLRTELDLSLALMGRPVARELDRNAVRLFDAPRA